MVRCKKQIRDKSGDRASKNTYDFFTIAKIIANVKDKEYSVYLAVWGILKDSMAGARTTIFPAKYEIEKVEFNNQKIDAPKELIIYLKNWMANNPKRFTEIINSELASMVLTPKTMEEIIKKLKANYE